MRTLTEILRAHQDEYHGVVPFDAGRDKIVQLDFTSANQDLTDDMINDIGKFTAYIQFTLAQALARYGVGGYAEHRTVYSRSRVFDATESGQEPRRLHLGLDIWADAGTPVYAPIPGWVHSVADNNRVGDYGATIILQHELEGEIFYSLYGHLSRASLANKLPGMAVAGGEWIADFGAPEENGHWPPHLHFQLIGDLQGHSGDYPGVCRFSERAVYLSNCPDPSLVISF
jgi:murein DD-endopeptidase MepM/ murein hydrolase activator NlpD